MRKPRLGQHREELEIKYEPVMTIERKLIHGQWVDVKVYKHPSLTPPSHGELPGASRSS